MGVWLRPRLLLVILLSAFQVLAQTPPVASYDELKHTSSPADSSITIRYKTPPIGTCSTVFTTQKQYTGYITIPPSPERPSQGNFTTNTFFWFIEARQLPESAPLTIFINGGPGSSSMVGLFQEVGPCQVVQVARDRLGTIAREWGWDRSSNLIFIDQPVQTGFSYDRLTNASLNLLDQSLTYPPISPPISQPEYTFLNGIFSSNNPTFTANTSQMAAESIYHFVQGFLSTFPQYRRTLHARDTLAESTVSIHLFTESYGGKYGPAMGVHFREQNARRLVDPVFSNATVGVSLQSLGIINGWVDALVQTPSGPNFAYNNTYGVRAIDQVQQLNSLSAFRGSGGCEELIRACRAQESVEDPDSSGDTPSVNTVCSQATLYCQTNVLGPYNAAGRSYYDISQYQLDPFPDAYYLEYLNTREVQSAIGAPVNFTQTSLAVYQAFMETGDWARTNVVDDLVDLLNDGVRVALIYGDRDYICNWLGGEAVSFSIASKAGPAYLPWYAADYAPIVSNESYIGGVVREFGNLSFSRIYDAGHLVPAYQPETMFTVFSRIISGTDISLGSVADLASYASIGDTNSTHQNAVPSPASPICFIRAVNSTCDIDQRNMLANRAGVIINGVLYKEESDWTPPDPDMIPIAGVPGEKPSIMTSELVSPQQTNPASSVESTISGEELTITTFPTGVFTATGVPSGATTTSESSATATGRRLADGIIDHTAVFLAIALAILPASYMWT